jgi:MATE family multidrug resistance protein
LIGSAFLGHFTEIRHLAGVALATILLSYIYRVLNFIRMGTTGITAQAVGQGDRQAMLMVGLRNGLVALVLGVALVVVQYPLQALWFGLLDAAPEVFLLTPPKCE